MKRIRIAVDMDEVMADYSGACLRALNAHYGTTYTKEQLKGMTLLERFRTYDDAPRTLHTILHDPHFYRTFDVIEGSVETLRTLSETYDIVIATAAMDVPPCFAAKYDWLEEHVPFIDPQSFIFCGNKNVVRAHYLIDDNATQLRRFEGTPLLFTAPHNETDDLPFTRLNDWNDVRSYFETKRKTR